jgi:hypothetical protein
MNDLTTVPYIGDDSMSYRMFCTTALPNDGPVRPETCNSLQIKTLKCECVLLV